MIARYLILFCSFIVVSPCCAMDFLGVLGAAGGGPGAAGQPQGVKFPIKDDPQLADYYTHDMFMNHCAQGDEEYIQKFLDEDKYEPFLNMAHQGNRPVAMAAFGYIKGQPIKETMPSVEGFRKLVEDDRVKKDFKIEVGSGLLAFDDWVLQEADYSKEDPDKHKRLIELRQILEKNTPKERRTTLKELLELRNKKKNAQKWQQSSSTNDRNKKIAFVVGIATVIAGVWLYSKRSRAKADLNTNTQVEV